MLRKMFVALVFVVLLFGTTSVSSAQNPTNVWRGEYFSNQHLRGNPTLVREDKEIKFDWAGAPATGLPTDHFSVRWTRDLFFTAGRYRFMTKTDDGVRLYVNGKLIIDRWYDQAAVWQPATIDLSSGTVTIVMEYYENVEGAAAYLHWDRIEGPAINPKFKGEYFNNIELKGKPVLVRDDAAIDFSWSGSPATGVNDNDFSVRWTQNRYMEAGRYRFTARTDDGVRLWVNNRLIIDNWRNQAATSVSAEIDLPGGDIPIKMEYYDHKGGAEARLSMSRIGGTQIRNWKGEYFNNQTLSGAPAMERDDDAIDFNWADGSPAWGTIGNDNFSVRWTRNVNLQAGRYRFTATADDGVRVWIQNQLIIDRWVTQEAQPFSAEIRIDNTGSFPIKVEYFERGGNASAKLTWQLIGGTTPVGVNNWRAEYFNNPNLTGAASVIRTDSAIDFNWASASPDPLISRDNFSARWTGNPRFDSGKYRFTVRADDGVRVWVDGTLRLDKWVMQAAQAHSFEIDLSAGAHAIRVEYFERTGEASIALTWSRIGDTTPTTHPIPSNAWRGEYYNNGALRGVPALVRTDAAIDFVWGHRAPAEGINMDNFSVRWTRSMTLDRGTYRFTVVADDGVRLWLNGRLVIDQWFDGNGTNTIEYFHSGGTLPVRMEYYDGGGWAQAKLSWTK